MVKKEAVGLLFALLLFSVFAYLYLSGLPCINADSQRGNADIAPYFCPEEMCASRVIGAINSSNSYVYIAMYTFTHQGIADALVAAKQRGVDVKVLLERENSNSEYSQYKALKDAGIPIKLDSNPALMHNKFAVIDGRLVITGSFNYTKSADESNNENIVFLYSSDAAGRYEAEFDMLFSEGS